MTASAASNTVSLRTRSKPQNKKTLSEENKQFDPGGEGGEQPPPWNAAVMVVFFFLRETLDLGCPLFVLCVLFLLVCRFAVFFCFLISGDHLFSELKNMRGDVDQATDVRNRRASIFLPINPSKIITAVSGSMHRMR